MNIYTYLGLFFLISKTLSTSDSIGISLPGSANIDVGNALPIPKTQTEVNFHLNNLSSSPELGTTSGSNFDLPMLAENWETQYRMLATYEPDYSERMVELIGISSISKDRALSTCYTAKMRFTGNSAGELNFGSFLTKSVYQEDNYISFSFEVSKSLDKADKIKASISSVFTLSSTYLKEASYMEQNVAYNYQFKSPVYTEFQLNEKGREIYATGDAIKFSTECGDYVTTKVDLNITVQMGIQYSFNTVENKKSFEVEAKVYFPFGEFSVKGGRSTTNAQYQGSITVSASQSGGDPNAFFSYTADGLEDITQAECDFKNIGKCSTMIGKLIDYVKSDAFLKQTEGNVFLPLSENAHSAIVSNVKSTPSPFFRHLNTTEFNLLVNKLEGYRVSMRIELDKAKDDLDLVNNFYNKITSQTDKCKRTVQYSLNVLAGISVTISKIQSKIDRLLDPFFGIQTCYSTEVSKCEKLVQEMASTKAYYDSSELRIYDDICGSKVCSSEDYIDQDNSVVISDASGYKIDMGFSLYRNKMALKTGSCTFGCAIQDENATCWKSHLKYGFLTFIVSLLILFSS